MDLMPAVGIYIAVPLVGLAAFIMLCRWMRRLEVQSPPVFSYLVLFSAVGGWLTVTLTELFWRWSGMASLGVAYLALVAPLLSAGAAFQLRKDRARSIFHRIAFLANTTYSSLMLAAVALVLVWPRGRA